MVAAAVLVAVLAAAAAAAAAAEEDLVGDIIIHGQERPLSGTDRVAILRSGADRLRYAHISSGEECALKRFSESSPVRR